jgi:hypothetical protein
MKTGKFLLISFVVGAFVGAATSTFFRTLLDPVVPADALSPEEVTGVTQAINEKALRQQIEEQRVEIALLKSKAAPMEVISEEAVEDPREAEREARREEFRARLEERMNERVDEMVVALGLNEGQRQLLAEVYRQQSENIRARRRGEEVEAFNFDGAVEGILTDEQFEKYVESSQEDIYNRAELMATTQMVRLSQAVELNTEQQGLVYDAIHFTAQEAMISRQTGEDYNMWEVMSERLSTILTEEQLQTFQESGAGGGGRPGPGSGRGGFGP